MLSRLLLSVVLGLLAAGPCWGQEKKQPEAKKGATAAAVAVPQPAHTFTISPEDAARANPEKFTDVSVERGKKLFLTQCAMCHGKAGDGKGEVVAEMGINPSDFTQPETLKNRTDGDLFAIIRGGSETMPGQGTRMREKQIWQMVNFLRALGGKKPEKAAGKEPEENVILVPQ